MWHRERRRCSWFQTLLDQQLDLYFKFQPLFRTFWQVLHISLWPKNIISYDHISSIYFFIKNFKNGLIMVILIMYSATASARQLLISNYYIFDCYPLLATQRIEIKLKKKLYLFTFNIDNYQLIMISIHFR